MGIGEKVREIQIIDRKMFKVWKFMAESKSCSQGGEGFLIQNLLHKSAMFNLEILSSNGVLK